MTVRILLIDIETAPSLAWVWGAYKTNVIDFKENWYILCYAYQWFGEDKITVHGLDDMQEELLIKRLWKLFDEADIIIAHNGDNFDVKRCNGMFLKYKLQPPAPYKTVDTLKIARKNFKLDKNSLDHISQYLGIGRKMSTPGFSLWMGCMNNDPSAWKTMKEYNVHDLELLHGVYTILRPWHAGHPNLNTYTGKESCPTCQGDHVQRRGFSVAKVQVRQRFHCTDCGSWFTGKIIKKT